jgi:PKD repeat protein
MRKSDVQVRNAVPALVVLMLALFPAAAQAAPWAIRGYEPDAPIAGEQVTFHAERNNGNGNPNSLVWDFGDGSGFGTGSDPTHVYDEPGTYSVKLYVPGDVDTLDLQDSVDVQVEAGPPPPPPPPPPPNSPPSAAFTFSPAGPLVGESVLFSGGSDPDGDPITREWNFGDLSPVSSGGAPSHAYAAAGSYTVSLSVSDDRGGFASTSRDITVSPAAEQPPAGPGTGTQDPGTPGTTPAPLPNRKPLARMRPFPVVRIAGVVLPHGALVKILSVRAPRGARVLVRCRGTGCPVRAVARSSATSVLRIRRFERTLRAGIRLELFVRKPQRIGKYTRFAIRAGKAPARVDRCLLPGSKRPVRCG